MLIHNGSLLNFGGDFRPVSLSPVKKVKYSINCQNTTKTPLEFEQLLGVGSFEYNDLSVCYILSMKYQYFSLGLELLLSGRQN